MEAKIFSQRRFCKEDLMKDFSQRSLHEGFWSANTTKYKFSAFSTHEMFAQEVRSENVHGVDPTKHYDST